MRSASFLLAATLLLASCGTIGDTLGGILGSPSADQPSDVRGTVYAVDTTNRRIDLDATYVNNLRDTSTSNEAVYYDDRTRVEFNGGTYNVADLERGDEVTIRGANSNGRYVAETITVTRDVSR
jgi:hypothetical protein